MIAEERVEIYSFHVHAYSEIEGASAARIENFRRRMDLYELLCKKWLDRKTFRYCMKRIDELLKIDRELMEIESGKQKKRK